MLRCVFALALFSALACTGGSPAPAPAPVAPVPEPAGRVKAGKGKAGKGAGRAPGKIPAVGKVDPLAGLTDRDLCAGGAAQLMLKYDLKALQAGKCGEVCCAVDAEHWCCNMDFPFNDVPPCDAWAVFRNELFARYGYPFTEQRWREEFEDESWYTRREDFDSSWLSPVVSANVATLQAYEKEKQGCMP